MRQLDGITDSMDMNLSQLQGMVKDSEAQHTAVHGFTKTPVGHDRATEEQKLYIILGTSLHLPDTQFPHTKNGKEEIDANQQSYSGEMSLKQNTTPGG